MAKYVFIKDYTAEIPAAGMGPTKNKTFKAGDVIEAGNDPGERNIMANLNVSTTIDGKMPKWGMVGQPWLSIPLSVLKETTNPVNINPVTTFSRTHQKEILFSAIGAAIGSYVAYRHKGGTADYILYAGAGAAAGLLIANVLINSNK